MAEQCPIIAVCPPEPTQVDNLGCYVPKGNGGEIHYLHLHELALALEADLQEGLARHVLHARVRLMHELKQLVHHSLEKLPVVAQEPGILTHNIPALQDNIATQLGCTQSGLYTLYLPHH